jgi:chromosome segregation ATPase
VIPATPLRPSDHDHHQTMGSNSLQAEFFSLLAQQDVRQAIRVRREQELEAKIAELEKGMSEVRQECGKWKSEAKRLRAARDSAVEDANVVRADRTRWRNKCHRLCASLEQNAQ